MESWNDDLPSVEARPRSGWRRRLAPMALALALVGGTAFGGVAGGAAMHYWLAQQSQTASASPVAPAGQRNAVLALEEGTPASVYASAGNAVVMVIVTTQRSRGQSSIPSGGEGSGFIVDEQGHILTNNHVVQGAREISVVLADGRRLSASVVGTDPGSDLAVLKVDLPEDKVAIAQLGDSDNLVVGEPVVAIGAPFGLQQTLTSGIVSALNRTFGTAGGRPMRGLIQTDAPINPGNSGGPLFNLRGEVVGIAVSIESPVRASVGIGFAIPSNAAKRLLPQLALGKKVEHPWLGISGQAITAQLAQAHQLAAEKGVLVIEAVAGGPAASAGINGGTSVSEGSVPVNGDIITAVDEKEVRAVEDIAGYLDTKQVGDTVTVDLLRDGQPLQIKVKLGAWQDVAQG